MELPSELPETSDKLKLFSEEYQVKTLGISWKPVSDSFVFSIELPEVRQLTKRALLSDSSKVFDPIGWLAPAVFAFKCLIQQTWVEGLTWDGDLPAHIADYWIQLRQDLLKLNDLQLPRCVIPMKQHTKQHHAFCDASEKGYAAVIYVRTQDTDGDVQLKLLTAKTRVAPVKTLSMPRLELCAAQLGANLLNLMKEVLGINDVYAWTDSTITLDWLSKLPRTWNVFVANRVANIQEILPRHPWNHVSTAENPADIASRGAKVSDLLENELWWKGPPWLLNGETNWPRYKAIVEESLEKREPKKVRY